MHRLWVLGERAIQRVVSLFRCVYMKYGTTYMFMYNILYRVFGFGARFRLVFVSACCVYSLSVSTFKVPEEHDLRLTDSRLCCTVVIFDRFLRATESAICNLE